MPLPSPPPRIDFKFRYIADGKAVGRTLRGAADDTTLVLDNSPLPISAIISITRFERRLLIQFVAANEADHGQPETRSVVIGVPAIHVESLHLLLNRSLATLRVAAAGRRLTAACPNYDPGLALLESNSLPKE